MKFEDFNLDLTKLPKANGISPLICDGTEDGSSGAGPSGISSNTSSDVISATCSCTFNTSNILCLFTLLGCV